MRFSRSFLLFILLLAVPSLLAARSKGSQGKAVDSGTFGVFMGGRRVGTETFTITQNANGSVVQSEFKTENTADHAIQNSEMQLTSGGEIRRYEWKEVSPGKAQSVVVPNDQFLTEKFSANPQEKEQEQPFLLPASTSILDDYFFIHREVLLWKFLATACHQEKGQLACPMKQRSQFGTMNPHQRSSAPVSIEFLGREKIAVRGADQDLLKVELKSEAGVWDFWLDDQFKVLRISIPSENTEVVRD